jgi:hypothetical protein
MLGKQQKLSLNKNARNLQDARILVGLVPGNKTRHPASAQCFLASSTN